ncbi:alcohol dehydrogenase catalytic domain-containing protein [Oricola thermophila]|uniref:Zinc-binding dehydrogenase n=1 Tax=Oricola thermophila TaxID=2742145 RepID=A0A6N1VGX4_9HYPH|nr:zinc-binding dehydrogenase [Oricola thermophila]QKV18257.1 zinc-binding dehydrogenase [Oricola thermophila]
MSRAWRIHDYSSYKGFVLEEETLVEPGEGEIRLKVEAFALNWGDMDLMKDNYSFSFRSFPAWVGIEAASVIEAVRLGVEGLSPGERVATLPYFYYDRGASTESLVTNQRYIAKAPPNLSPVECASIWMRYLTAYFPLAEVSGGGKQPCSRDTGDQHDRLARELGATMIGTARFRRNTDYLHGMGADQVIVTGRDDGATAIDRITGRKGIGVAFDPVGAGLIDKYDTALARDARIDFYGTLDR